MATPHTPRNGNTEPTGKLSDESLDFCHVDASPVFEPVLSDLEAALPKMRPD
jgi:hypothetical protein